VGAAPPLVGVAEKLTLLPWQIVVVPAVWVMPTLATTGAAEASVMVTGVAAMYFDGFSLETSLIIP
jgi:hypothetical protein